MSLNVWRSERVRTPIIGDLTRTSRCVNCKLYVRRRPRKAARELHLTFSSFSEDDSRTPKWGAPGSHGGRQGRFWLTETRNLLFMKEIISLNLSPVVMLIFSARCLRKAAHSSPMPPVIVKWDEGSSFNLDHSLIVGVLFPFCWDFCSLLLFDGACGCKWYVDRCPKTYDADVEYLYCASCDGCLRV